MRIELSSILGFVAYKATICDFLGEDKKHLENKRQPDNEVLRFQGIVGKRVRRIECWLQRASESNARLGNLYLGTAGSIMDNEVEGLVVHGGAGGVAEMRIEDRPRPA